MTKLGELAAVLRSKNAGPFLVTIDLLFEAQADFERVASSGALEPAGLVSLLGVPVEEISVIHFPMAYAIKITIPRVRSAGSPFDTDVYGAQQHAPLLGIEIPGRT